MQELPKLHRNYYSGAMVWRSVHPAEKNILLLNNIDNVQLNSSAVIMERARDGFYLEEMLTRVMR